MRARFAVIAASLALACGAARAVAAPSPPSAKFGAQWKALVGEWSGEGEGGAKSGACGFHFDLSDHIIVRTNHAELPVPGAGGNALHDDLMVIYPGVAPDKASAVYFDNEGHVINYDAEWSTDGKTLTFLSKPGSGPQFRLVYRNLDAKSWTVSFEMAPPGQTTFKPYTSGTIRRVGK